MSYFQNIFTKAKALVFPKKKTTPTTRTIFDTELTSGPPAVPPQSKLKVPAVGTAQTERGRWPDASAVCKRRLWV